MALDFFNLPIPPRPQSTRTYDQDGVPLTFTLRWPNASDRALASEDAAAMVRDYIDGDRELGREAAPFPDPETIPSATLFQACAIVARMQAPTSSERREPLEFALLASRLPRTWMAIQQEVNRLLQEGEQRQGGSPGAPGESSAATPSSPTTSTP
jgi:hypothetical protein